MVFLLSFFIHHGDTEGTEQFFVLPDREMPIGQKGNARAA
jgi:hypothetical protein